MIGLAPEESNSDYADRSKHSLKIASYQLTRLYHHHFRYLCYPFLGIHNFYSPSNF